MKARKGGKHKNKPPRTFEAIETALTAIIFLLLLSLMFATGYLMYIGIMQTGALTFVNFMGLALIIIGAFAFWDVFRYFVLNYALRAVPKTAIEGIAMGLTRIEGKVAPFPKQKLMTSPMSKRKCVYWQVDRISRKADIYTIIKELEKFRDKVKKIKFYLRDSTGQVLVDPKWAAIEPKVSRKRSAEFTDYIERVIEPGDKLYILGTAGDNPYVEETTAQKAVRDIMIQHGKKAMFSISPPYFITRKPITGGTAFPIKWPKLIVSIILILLGVILITIKLGLGGIA